MSEAHLSGLYYVIPDFVMDNENLKPLEKLLFGFLSGLAHGRTEKECFPGNEYLATRMGVSVKYISIMLNNLEEEGLISRRTERNIERFCRPKRYITVLPKFKKCLPKEPQFANDREPQFANDREPQFAIEGKGYLEGKGKEPSLQEGKKGDSGESPPPAPQRKNIANVASKKRFVDHVLLSDEEYLKLKKQFGEAITEKYIQKLDAYIGSKGKKYKSHYKTIINWLLNDEKTDKKDPNKKGKGLRQ